VNRSRFPIRKSVPSAFCCAPIVYARVKNLIYDDSEFDPREAYPMINEVMREDDANDPWLESYQQP
jgi:hypothetical protein